MDKLTKLETKLRELEQQFEILSRTVASLSETSYKTSSREIINREVQFLQKVYDKNGAVVSEINS